MRSFDEIKNQDQALEHLSRKPRFVGRRLGKCGLMSTSAKWCEANGRKMDSSARSEFVVTKRLLGDAHFAANLGNRQSEFVLFEGAGDL